MMVSVRRPRKSNLTRPTASTSSLSYWVTTPPPPASQYSGAKSVSGVGAITTPPACLPALRVRFSSFSARSISARASSSCSYASQNSLTTRSVSFFDFSERPSASDKREIERARRHHLGEPVDLAVRHAQHAAGVAQHGLGRHRAVGDDLADAGRGRICARRSRSPRRGDPCRSRCRSRASTRVRD